MSLPTRHTTRSDKDDLISPETRFDSLFDVLRVEGIVGIDAFNHINNILTLKLLESRLASGMYPFDPDAVDNSNLITEIIQSKVYLWSNLLRVSDDSLLITVKDVFFAMGTNTILEKHVPAPSEFKIQQTSTIRRICQAIEATDVTGDSFGDIYENMLSRQMVGKDLGQFFTPYWVRKYIVDLVQIQKNPDGTFPTICDPAAGTGGFLASAVRALKNQGPIDGIDRYLFGTEINRDTYRGGTKHLLIATGQDVPGFCLGDSLRFSSSQQYNYILTNPPFGLKGVKWTETDCPIKTNNGTSLFLQKIIQLLAVGGKAGVVFPMGQEIFSGGDLADLRKLLLKCCRLDAVIRLPKQTFINTNCATCILLFTKVYDIKQVMTSQTKGRMQVRSFVDGAATQQVGFYEIVNIPTAEPDVRGILAVPVSRIAENGWSLRVEEYQQKEVAENQNHWPVYPLNQLCTFKNGTNITKSKLVDGPYPVVGGGRSPMGVHDRANVAARTILISKDGAYAGYVSRYESPVFVTNHGIFVEKIDSRISPDYLYLVLKYSLQDKLYSLQRGMAQPGIKKEQIAELTISLPPMDEQLKVLDEANRIELQIKLIELQIKRAQEEIAQHNQKLTNLIH